MKGKKRPTEKLVDAFSIITGRKPSPDRSKKKGVKPSGTTVLDHPELGRIQVAVSRRSRRITLTVKPDCTVRLSIPYGTPLDHGLAFLELKKEWARDSLTKYRSHRQLLVPPFRTRQHELVTRQVEDNKAVSVRISNGKIILNYPRGAELRNENIQQAVKKGVCEALRKEALEYLPVRLEQLSALTGLKFGKVAVRNTVSKWGSCSARNDISLSLHLMRLPDHLIDYVLLHELCHTVHKNHGPQFHELLDSVSGGRHLRLRKELRGYHTRW